MKNTSHFGVTIVENAALVVGTVIIAAIIGLLAATAIRAHQKIHDKNVGVVPITKIGSDGQFTFSEAGYVTSERAIVITDTKTGKRFLAVRNYGIAPLDEVKVESK
jgi:hypothetical protein